MRWNSSDKSLYFVTVKSNVLVWYSDKVRHFVVVKSNKTIRWSVAKL